MIQSNTIHTYFALTRLNKPIGILLLLWPTLAALWIASNGLPQLSILFIFITGVILTRSAGCILNDLADQKFDQHVKRTQSRPLANKKISNKSALILCGFLLLLALILVLQLNRFTIFLAFIAVALTAFYPFTKRFTQLPQLILGLTFNLGILMAFTAVQDKIPAIAWLLYLIAIIWTVVYDTMYAMADREDDLKIGIQSTAILFGAADCKIIALLQFTIMGMLIGLGLLLHTSLWFYIGLSMAGVLFLYQQYLIRTGLPNLAFKAFLNNHWAWMMVFIGLLFGMRSCHL